MDTMNISQEILQAFSTGEVAVAPITIFAIIIGAIFVNNVVLSQFLGICPFLGVSKKIDQATGMGLSVIFVMLMATAATWPIYNYLLVPNGLEYLNTIAFILVIFLFVYFYFKVKCI